MATELKLPELGENIKEVQVTRVLVAVGDRIMVDQSLIEMETGKATVELPSPVQGTIRQLLVKEGDKLQIGQSILLFDANEEEKMIAGVETKPAAIPEVAGKALASSQPMAKSEEPTPCALASQVPMQPVSSPFASTTQTIIAAPSVRTFAREIGMDISQVPPSGQGGRVTIEDVKAFARRLHTSAAPPPPAATTLKPSLPDFAKWGPVERESFSPVRKATAKHMIRAWSEIPHVTQHDVADITALEELRQRHLEKARASGGKLTLTAILVKVVEGALKIYPRLNASIDMANGQIIYKKYCHIGVAMDTPRGLLVPVIRDVDRKNIIQISAELVQLVEKARAGKLKLDDLQGGTFTLTNLGGIGGGHFTPIINWPEVAILGIGRSSHQPAVVEGQIQSRLMLPLSLSYDHRLVDGAEAARFLRGVIEAITEPRRLALEG